MSDDFLAETRDGITHLTFNRPQARNAMTLQMYEALKAACLAVPTDGSVKSVIISGAGEKAFAAGTDMTEFRGFSTPQQAWDYEKNMDSVLGAVEACPVPTIAAINGACTGGGAAIAAACDIRLATGTLKFGFPIARTLGNCLSANNLVRLSNLMGPGRVKEMLLTARLIEADEALRIGLVSELLPDGEALKVCAMGIAEKLASHAPLTLRATKEAMRRIAQAQKIDDHDLIELCYMSADFKEGMEAFLSKRKPEWTGR